MVRVAMTAMNRRTLNNLFLISVDRSKILSMYINSVLVVMLLLICITLIFISLHSYGSVLVTTIWLNRWYLELCSDLQILLDFQSL